MNKQSSDILVGISMEDENGIVNAAHNYARILKIFHDALVEKGFDEPMVQNMTLQYMNLIQFNSIGGSSQLEEEETIVITEEDLQQLMTEEENKKDPLSGAKGIGLGCLLGFIFWGIIWLIFK